MDFREASAGDAVNLAALTLQVWLHTYARQGLRNALSDYVLSEFTADKFRQSLADARQAFIVCEQDAHLVGYVRLNFSAPCPVDDRLRGEIATLYVQTHFLRRGIGTQLLQRALDAFRGRGAEAVWLSVHHENAAAIGFYAGNDFVRSGSVDFELDGERHENFVLRRAFETGERFVPVARS